MSSATLLLREEAAASLSALVEKSQERKPPLPEYELHLTANQLDLVLRTKPETNTDEGFESDIDSLSIVSSDGSFTPETKTTETDSANGSTSSDSDTETNNNESLRNYPKESYNLVDCVCYTDVKFPDVLLFVIKQQALVFRFDNLNNLKNFYLNFTALKAVTNQKAYNKNLTTTKFNLLQRTDNNGITHIEITREPEPLYLTHQRLSNVILSTPEITERTRLVNETTLRKVWNSAEDLLMPKRPERRKKLKGKAPLPPVVPSVPSTSPQDILCGEYVRVNVNADSHKEKDFIAKSQLKEKKPPIRPNLVTLLTPKPKMEPSWTNSVPRLLKKQRSKSETRNFTPMAYRYIDTAPNYPSSTMGNRLFGLSPKLREFQPSTRWSSVGELTYKNDNGNLKSVIKKDENKKKNNEKKVTFSAYTTVQVV